MEKFSTKSHGTMRKLMCLMLVVIAIVAALPVQAYALSNDVHDILFDWEYYYSANPDVARAFGKNPTSLRNHFNSYGKKEGRAPSELFDAKTYLSLYSDLKKAFGNDYKQAYNHFVSYGINEGRKGSSKFDVSVYKANYADLRNAYGNNNLKYFKHYREYGKREGRNAVKRISTASNSKPSSSKSSTTTTTVTNLKNGGKYIINFKNTNMGINVQYAPRQGVGNLVLDGTSDKQGNEVWTFTYNSKYKAYYITPQYRPGAAINALYGAKAQKGSQAKLHDSNVNDTASLWYVEKSGSYYRFKNVASGYYLDVDCGKTKAGTRINLWQSDASNQQFGLVEVKSSTKFVWPVGGNGGTDQKNWPKYKSSGLYHSGTDITAKTGTPVYAAYGGTVYSAFTKKDSSGKVISYGKHVVIKCNVDGQTVYMYYCHLNKYNVKQGDVVSTGQQIGEVGSTGKSDGPHLHFEVRNSSNSYGSLSKPTLNPYNFLPVR